ncbi:hypothetical protein [Actinophytocola sp.]|uniref:hypothetical protein n=1 Tax=Actinophytocola sp. TaxID=1872138 RepID=UPI002D7FF763|nr:hypothetical protein [Actinophytocola sp.]HET9142449.1 hypothetical protein [Actinophytocola sp.]
MLLGDRTGVAELLGDVLGAASGLAHERADGLAPHPRGDPLEPGGVEGGPQALVAVGLVEPAAAHGREEGALAGGGLAAQPHRLRPVRHAHQDAGPLALAARYPADVFAAVVDEVGVDVDRDEGLAGVGIGVALDVGAAQGERLAEPGPGGQARLGQVGQVGPDRAALAQPPAEPVGLVDLLLAELLQPAEHVLDLVLGHRRHAAGVRGLVIVVGEIVAPGQCLDGAHRVAGDGTTTDGELADPGDDGASLLRALVAHREVDVFNRLVDDVDRLLELTHPHVAEVALDGLEDGHVGTAGVRRHAPLVDLVLHVVQVDLGGIGESRVAVDLSFPRGDLVFRQFLLQRTLGGRG